MSVTVERVPRVWSTVFCRNANWVPRTIGSVEVDLGKDDVDGRERDQILPEDWLQVHFESRAGWGFANDFVKWLNAFTTMIKG